MQKAIAATLVCMAVAGCSSSGMSRALEYNFKTHHVEMADDTYRIFEHPTEDVVMTTPSVGASVGTSFAEGMTLGIADLQTPEQLHEAAARKYLDETGRAECKITSGYLLVKPQYEFTFECPGSETPKT